MGRPAAIRDASPCAHPGMNTSGTVNLAGAQWDWGVHYILRFPADDAAVRQASADHQYNGLSPTWPVLARYRLERGHSWAQICATLGFDQPTSDDTAEVTDQVERLTADKKHVERVVDTKTAENRSLRRQLEEA